MTPPLQTTLVHRACGPEPGWWRDAVIYQIYPRSWADGDGDGVGDLPGVTARLGHLARLGVDAIWFSPFFRSPQADAGYDVADYRDVDPLFGSMTDLDALLTRAHDLGLKVLLDLVPNHTSDQHAWFRAALSAPRGGAERERYLFRDGRGPDGDEPPNDWRSVFGGPAWSRVTEADGRPGQWYLHLFDVHQPDLNWRNQEVRDEFLDVLRFWLDRGVDGFRVDVAHGLVKKEGLPDWPEQTRLLGEDPTSDAPMWDQDEVHEIYRGWRRLLDEYHDPERIMCAEAWVTPEARLARYVRPHEFHQAFNFDYLEAPWRAGDLLETMTGSIAATDAVGAPATWVLSNHDVVRHASRLGLPVGLRRPNGIGKDDVQPDRLLGLVRARAATTLMLALPGGAYLYQGEELGLPESTDMPDAVRQDPTFHKTGGEHLGRDGCRVPMPWRRDAPALGFNDTGRTWLPQPEVYREYAVDQQEGVKGSTLELYRTLLALRSERGLGAGSLRTVQGCGEDVVALVNGGRENTCPTLVLANLGQEPVAIPDGAEVLVASGDLTEDGRVPVDTAVWADLPGWSAT